MWSIRISSALSSGRSVSLRNLYQGEYWTRARELEAVADLRVVSAGLGLSTLDSPGVGYGATFSPRMDDSVRRFAGGKPDVSAAWWFGLRENGIGEPLPHNLGEVVIFACSEHYQLAVSGDLLDLGKNGHTVIVVSGSSPIPRLSGARGIFHIETGQWIRMVLGGSTPNVGIRFTSHLIKTGLWSSPENARLALKALQREYESTRTHKLPTFDRIQRSDDEIRQWIHQKVVNTTVTVTKSSLLTQFRAEGFACEQKRFGQLFIEVTRK